MAFFLLVAYTLANMTTIRATDDIYAAKIFMKLDSTVGDEVEAVCSTFGFKSNQSKSVYIYLCKNGIGIMRQLQNKDFETKMILKNVAKEDTGNYSCAFSYYEYKPNKIQKTGYNFVFFQVFDNFIPANIALRDESVSEGDDVVLRCTLQDVQMLHSSTAFAYLSKDGVPVQLQRWDTEKNEANFTIKGFTEENNGNYSCILFKSGLLTSTTMKLYGNNTILLAARATFSGPILIIGYGAFILLVIVVMMVGVWLYRVTKKGKSKSGPERKQEEENKNNTEIHQTTADVPVLENNTFQDTGCHPYDSAEFSDEGETSICDEHWLYHEIETELPICSTPEKNKKN